MLWNGFRNQSPKFQLGNHLEKLTGYGVCWRSFTEEHLDSCGCSAMLCCRSSRRSRNRSVSGGRSALLPPSPNCGAKANGAPRTAASRS
jgi:hypothetical protein